MKKLPSYLFIVLLPLFLWSCGQSENQIPGPSSGSGSIILRAEWPVDSQSYGNSGLYSAAQSTVNQVPVGVDTIRVIVSGPGMKDMQQDFDPMSGSGTIHKVPVGKDRIVTLQGLGTNGAVAYEGYAAGITVLQGQITDCGTIIIDQIGSIAWIKEAGTVVKVSSSQAELFRVNNINCRSLSAYAQFALDPNDNSLWIADTNNNRILKLDEQGELIALINQYSAHGTAVDPRDGSVWSSEYISGLSHRLVKRDSLGLKILETDLGLTSSMMDNAMAWYSRDDSLFFADYTQFVFKVWGADTELDGYNISGFSGTNHLRLAGFTGQPFTVSTYPGDSSGGEGHIWASDRDGAVFQFSDTGVQNLYRKPSGIFAVHTVSADVSDGSVWLTGYDRVAKYSATGDPLINIGGFTSLNTIEADPLDGGAWVGDDSGLIKLSSTGTEEWRRDIDSVSSIVLQTQIKRFNRIYVSTGGNDDNGNGTRRYPYQTIGKSLASAMYGDAVLVAEGTYNENIALKSGIKIVGSGADVTRIEGLGTSHVVDGTAVQNAAIIGFTITGSSTSTSGIYCADCTGLIMSQNRIIDNGSSTTSNGILLMGSSTAIIEQNEITGNANNGIGIGGSSVAIIRNNIIARNDDCGIYNNSEDTSYIINNVIDSNGTVSWGRSGILTWENDVIKNNIISNNGTNNPNVGLSVGIYVRSPATPTLSFNNVFNNYQGDYTGVAPGKGDISADPLFVDQSSGDYSLQSGSPSINTGDPELHDEDFPCGDIGSRSDMGAYGGPWGDW